MLIPMEVVVLVSLLLDNLNWWQILVQKIAHTFGVEPLFSAPIVSRVLAIYLQERPSLGVQDLTQLLID